MKFNKIILIFPIVLAGCSTISLFEPLQKYTPPDPQHAPTARLRIAVVAGVSARVTLNRNTNNACLNEEGAVQLPVHLNTSGFSGKSKMRIGMPMLEPYWGDIGSEMYIPASTPLTIAAQFSGRGAGAGASCKQAIKFQPLSGKDYQMFMTAGSSPSGRGVCEFHFKEIISHKDSPTALMEMIDVPYEPVVVKGSPAWPVMCAAK